MAYWSYVGNNSGTDHHAFRSGGSDSILIGSSTSNFPYDDHQLVSCSYKI